MAIEGTYLMGSEPTDFYPNDETEAFYVKVPGANFETYGFEATYRAILDWTEPRIIVGDPMVMTKTRGVELIGFATGPGQLRIAEGVIDFAMGDAILRSPARPDRVWSNERKVFEKKYDLQ